MYAVIKTGGKQYRVKEGDLLEIEKLGAEKGQKINFVGTPVVENAVVRAEVVENYKGDKVLIFKKKRRKQYRRTKGHRQELTKVRIEKIHPDTKLVPEDDLRVEALPVRTAAPKVETPAKKAPKPAVKKAAQPKAAPKKKTEAKPTAKPKKKVKE